MMRMNRAATGLAVVFMIAATFAAYRGVLSCGFVSFDDREYVYENPRVLAGLSWAGWWYAWTSLDCANWHPLTWLSLEMDGSLWGRNPAGYHATNLVLHCLNGVLLFAVLRYATSSFYRSAIVALLFLLHPLHVESVAWIAERKDVLSTFFLLLTMAAYFRYAEHSSWLWYLVVGTLFALGLLAKPMLVTLPILLLLLDIWPLNRIEESVSPVDAVPQERVRFPRRPVRSLVLEKIPLVMLAFADGLMTVFAQKGAAAMLNKLSFETRLANMFHAYGWYLQKTLIPTKLAVFYPHPEGNLSWSLVAGGILLLLTISAFVIWKRQSQPFAVVGWGWFCISLLPVIGLLQVGGQAYADRYAYVPHIGLLIAIVWSLHSCFADTPRSRLLGGVVAVLAIASCLILTRSQVKYWKSSESLWARALEVTPDNGVAHAHLADTLKDAGDYEQAIEHIRQGLRLKRSGNSANAHLNWAMCLIALNRSDEAESHFIEALKIDANHAVALEEFAKLLQKQGRLSEAAQVSARYAAVLARQAEARPDSAKELKLGILSAKQGDFPTALRRFQDAIKLAPQSAAAHNNLGLTLLQLNRTNEAQSNFLRAIELNPQLASAHFCLAELLEAEKDFEGAKRHFAEALRLNPGDIEARQGVERLSR